MADRRDHLISELRHAQLWLTDVSQQVEIATKRVESLQAALRSLDQAAPLEGVNR